MKSMNTFLLISPLFAFFSCGQNNTHLADVQRVATANQKNITGPDAAAIMRDIQKIKIISKSFVQTLNSAAENSAHYPFLMSDAVLSESFGISAILCQAGATGTSLADLSYIKKCALTLSSGERVGLDQEDSGRLIELLKMVGVRAENPPLRTYWLQFLSCSNQYVAASENRVATCIAILN